MGCMLSSPEEEPDELGEPPVPKDYGTVYGKRNRVPKLFPTLEQLPLSVFASPVRIVKYFDNELSRLRMLDEQGRVVRAGMMYDRASGQIVLSVMPLASGANVGEYRAAVRDGDARFNRSCVEQVYVVFRAHRQAKMRQHRASDESRERPRASSFRSSESSE
jgi:hypothetical protein